MILSKYFDSLVLKSNNKLVRKGGIFLFTKLTNLLGNLGVKSRISFGEISIYVPANHSSVLWSVLVPGMNWNLGRLAKHVSLMDPVTTIIDVGANVGDTYAIIRGSNVHVPLIAIEGDPAFISWLRLNTFRDPLVSIWEGFVGDDDVSLVFESSQNGASTGMVRKHRGTGHPIKLTALDKIIELSNVKKVGLIKVDTDGFDTKIVRSAHQVLHRDHPVLFLEIQPYHLMRNDNIDSFFKWLQQFGYKEMLLWDNFGRFLCNIDFSKPTLIKQLMAYFHGAPEMPFLDIAFFHYLDDKLLKSVISDEIELACNTFSIHESVSEMSIQSLYDAS